MLDLLMVSFTYVAVHFVSSGNGGGYIYARVCRIWIFKQVSTKYLHVDKYVLKYLDGSMHMRMFRQHMYNAAHVLCG